MSSSSSTTTDSPACPACDAEDTDKRLEKFALSMYGCRQCGIVFTHPIPPEDVVGSRYSAHWFEREYLPSYGIDPSNPSLDHLASRYDAELAPLESYRELGRILDVGAGAGLFMSQARRRGWDVHGVELSSFGPLFAKIHFGLEIRQGTLEQAAYPDAHFDVVMLQDTIEHVPDPFGMLSEVARILRTGGAVVISTPNFRSIGRRAIGDAWALISPSEHLFLFCPRSLDRILRRAGMEPVEISTTGGVNAALSHGTSRFRSRVAAWLSKSLPPKLVSHLKAGDELLCTAVRT